MTILPLRSSLAAALLVGAAAAQSAEPSAGLVAMHQALLDAGSDVVVLNVAAHPDDEASRTDTMLRRLYGMRVVTVYSTFGEGGQNAIGREIGPALARIRVAETLRAAAMTDVEVRWLGLPEFGFSKTLEETLRVWGAERLKDAMRAVIDEIDPDVILTNHTIDRGHGHHRASFWAATEILKERQAAGRHVPRLYSRCGPDRSQLAFDPSRLDLARGETFAALAWKAWTQHVSQGPWRAHDPLRVGADHWRVAFPEGVSDADAGDLSQWSRGGLDKLLIQPSMFGVAGDDPLHGVMLELRMARALRDRAAADVSTPRALRQARLLFRRSVALQRLYLAMRGVRIEAWLTDDELALGGWGTGYVVVHGHELLQDLQVRCDGASAEPVRLPVQPTFFDDVPTPKPKEPEGGDDPDEAPAAPAAEPETPPLPGRFEVSFACALELDDELPTTPEPEAVEVDVSFTLDDLRFDCFETLRYTPVRPIELRWDRDVVVVPRGQKSERLLSVSLENHRERRSDAGVRLAMGPGIDATAVPDHLILTGEQRDARILVRATIDADEMTPDARLAIGFRDELVSLPMRLVDVTVPPGMNIGLVRGPEDSAERTLADLGIPFTTLDRDALVTTRLESFTTLLLDIRAYHHRPELAEVRDRLLQYCRGGGRIVAMYHKPGEWNERDGHPMLAPFALVVGNDRVTEEDAPVTVLQPQHRLMSWPHQIGEEEFAGWVQERGLNFPKTWDPAWTPLLSMKDSGDPQPFEGALLVTQYGKGDFVYCSLALYRQLRIGNPGAVRLLVNLLAR
ncbi:MAG: PIG-L family deacetylase [Planctomycetes bacterium]|nr:PIG-L family deacetylase [Planctomycetota bacterium]